MDKIVLYGNPLSNQHIYGQTGNRRYMKNVGKERKEQYQWEAKSQWRKPCRKGRIAMDVVLYFKTRGKKDVDNFAKLALDCLEGIVYEDDEQVDSLNLEKTFDKENPRIEIYIH